MVGAGCAAYLRLTLARAAADPLSLTYRWLADDLHAAVASHLDQACVLRGIRGRWRGCHHHHEPAACGLPPASCSSCCCCPVHSALLQAVREGAQQRSWSPASSASCTDIERQPWQIGAWPEPPCRHQNCFEERPAAARFHGR
jgi:hypothetical protein